jgi:outer membrane biosynthesis protein TonB
MKRRTGQGRLGTALILSALLHGGVIAFFWASSLGAAPVPALRVYAVDIVSGPAPAEAPAPEPAAEPAPAEPEPEPLAPEPEPVQTLPPPAPAPAPTPAPPAQRPPEPRPAPTPPAQRPPEPRPASTPPAQRPPEPRPAAQRPAAQPQPSAPTTPPASAAASAGGSDGATIRTEGVRCPSEAYCNNIARQVQRYFRRPAQARSDRGDVCFRLDRSGSAADIEVQRLQGSFAFRLALMEAVEQASRNNEFGPMPRSFNAESLPICVGFTPES